jgi:hypothetical protein
MTMPPSIERVAIMRFIHASGKTGVTSEQVREHTGLPTLVARMHIKNLVRLGDAISTPTDTRERRYTSALVRPPELSTARATGLQAIRSRPAERNIARITKAGDRSPNISAERRHMEEALRRQTEPRNSRFMSDLLGISRRTGRDLLGRMQRDGVAAIVGEDEQGVSLFLWADTWRNQPKNQRAEPVRNSNQPNGTTEYWRKFISQMMTPARQDAQA